ncbi:MAG: D-alanyl-D-alanine carboxypeptidase family protein [Pseudomonadota bacterium]
MAYRVMCAIFFALVMAAGAVPVANAAPYAAIVVDARDGSVLHSRSADRRLHPASLTKMMTLYLTFEALEAGTLTLDQQVRISANAAAEPPSRLGLQQGQRITIRHLIRSAAIKSANDSATALGEAIAGSERAFAELMTARAHSLGMRNTTFRNAHGLTQSGHLSTARDMSVLARHLIFDFPQYYNIFGRRSTPVGSRTLYNTNRRLLGSYLGADGIKTGYTRAAGFNLVASAERGGERVIAVVFGGRSARTRDARVAELLDMGFNRAPSHVATVLPRRPGSGGVSRSVRPRPRGAAPESAIAVAVRSVGDALIPAAAAASTSSAAIELAVNIATPTTEHAPLMAARPRPRYDGMQGAWAVQLGAFRRETTANSALDGAVIARTAALRGARGQVRPAMVSGVELYEARYFGLSETAARQACAALQEDGEICRLVSPES